MPSPQHDALNALFRNRPAFALELLRDHFGVAVPPAGVAEVAPGDFNDRPSRDCQADTVVMAGPRHGRTHGAIVEVQLDIKEDKRKAWPRYAAALWLREDCPVEVLVVCTDTRVAAWASRPIPTALPGYVLHPRVLGPDRIPAVTDASQAADCLELATLSVMAHGHRREVPEAFMAALSKVADGDSAQYYEHAWKLSPLSARRILEDLMASTTWPVHSPFAREHFGKGKEEGKTEGKTEGEARALIRVLKARDLLTEEAHARIDACKDPDQLEAWIERAATATSTDQIFT